MNRNFIMEQVIKVKQISAAQIVKLVGLIIFLGVMPEDLFTKIFSISQRAGTPLFVWKILIYYCLFFVYLLVVFLHYKKQKLKGIILQEKSFLILKVAVFFLFLSFYLSFAEMSFCLWGFYNPFYFIPFYIIARIAFHKLKYKSLYLAVIWTFPLFFIAQIELQYKMFNARSEQLEKLYYKPQILSSEFFYKLTEDKRRQNSFDTQDILNFSQKTPTGELVPRIKFYDGKIEDEHFVYLVEKIGLFYRKYKDNPDDLYNNYYILFYRVNSTLCQFPFKDNRTEYKADCVYRIPVRQFVLGNVNDLSSYIIAWRIREIYQMPFVFPWYIVYPGTFIYKSEAPQIELNKLLKPDVRLMEL